MLGTQLPYFSLRFALYRLAVDGRMGNAIQFGMIGACGRCRGACARCSTHGDGGWRDACGPGAAPGGGRFNGRRA
jgi:hypothetical protein